MKLAGTRKLLVEDNDQQFAIAELMKNFVSDWGTDLQTWKVPIHSCNGVTNVLNRSALLADLKVHEREALGIVVDANDSFESRWDSIKGFCIDHFGNVPDQMPEGGLILSYATGARFGAWIMPDNKSEGMVETFCRYMVPDSAENLWQFAEQSYQESKAHGADWLDAHKAKAHIHTWLAWQNPPGERMGLAIAKKALNPNAEACRPFVKWFHDLFHV